jgi:hypothetical protein
VIDRLSCLDLNFVKQTTTRMEPTLGGDPVLRYSPPFSVTRRDSSWRHRFTLLSLHNELPRLGSLWIRSVGVNPRSQDSLLRLLLFGVAFGMAV